MWPAEERYVPADAVDMVLSSSTTQEQTDYIKLLVPDGPLQRGRLYKLSVKLVTPLIFTAEKALVQIQRARRILYLNLSLHNLSVRNRRGITLKRLSAALFSRAQSRSSARSTSDGFIAPWRKRPYRNCFRTGNELASLSRLTRFERAGKDDMISRVRTFLPHTTSDLRVRLAVTYI